MDKVFCGGCGLEWIWTTWDYGFSYKTGKLRHFGQWKCPNFKKVSHPSHTYDQNTYELINGEWKKYP